jgi:hypothetical protein
LLPAPTLPQPVQYAPAAPRVMKFSYTVPAGLPASTPKAPKEETKYLIPKAES